MELAAGRNAGLVVTVVALLAAPVALASPGSQTLALVVTNNRSTTLALPDLQYADDDGARYYRLFRSVADQDNVMLLTSFDRASAAAYPDLVGLAHAPTLTSLQAAVARLADAAKQARQLGQTTTFYFVYAGHGDVDNGRGFIDLEDGQIDGQFIESAILDKIPAAHKHVILDSCNSFFVMNPRKPGGRRWATPKDMAMGFAKRHPEVGLFLSTSSDAEVFEWSELESGVFSHEVRSGLSGAADVDGDGSISYSELAGFVDRANARIGRDVLRPHIYYRGPSGDAAAPLFVWASATGRQLVLDDAETRLWIKSDAGERLLDLHKEPGPMTVLLPGPADARISVYVEHAAVEGGRPTVEARAVSDELSTRQPATQARGDSRFTLLFADAYGPKSYGSFLAASAREPEPVYGISNADVTRMHNYISAMAADNRQGRLLLGGMLLGVGAVFTSASVVSYADSPRWAGSGDRTRALAFGGVGAGMMGGGLAMLLVHSAGENALATFEKELAASGGNRSVAFARTDQALEDLAHRERRLRSALFWVYEGLAAGLATAGTVGLIRPGSGDSRVQPSTVAAFYGFAVFMGGVGIAALNITTPTERLLKLYHSDPDLQLNVGVAPTPSGGMVGLSGAF
jgi:hypothetical protein